MVPALLGCASNSSTTLTTEIHPPTETATSFGLNTSENCIPTLDPDSCINEEAIRETGGVIRNDETDLIDIAGVGAMAVLSPLLAYWLVSYAVPKVVVCAVLLPAELSLDFKIDGCFQDF